MRTSGEIAKCGRCKYWQQRYERDNSHNLEGYCNYQPEKILRRFEDIPCHSKVAKYEK